MVLCLPRSVSGVCLTVHQEGALSRYLFDMELLDLKLPEEEGKPRDWVSDGLEYSASQTRKIYTMSLAISESQVPLLENKGQKKMTPFGSDLL